MILMYVLYAAAILVSDVIFLMYAINIRFYLLILLGLLTVLFAARVTETATVHHQENVHPDDRELRRWMTPRRFLFLSLPVLVSLALNHVFLS